MIMAGEHSLASGARAGRRPPGRALLAKLVSVDSYGLVLVLVVVTYLVRCPSWPGGPSRSSWRYSSSVWLTFRTARTRLSAQVLVVLVFLAVAAVAIVNLFVAVSSEGLAVAFVVSTVLYVVAPFAVVRDIATRRSVDQEVVLGAIAAYLIVGMFFAFTYRAIDVLQATPFFGAEGPGDMAQALFFSFVTLTTPGYGNLVPATNPGQSLAVMEAVLGQLFLVTAVAKIITAWKPRRWRSADEPD